MDNRSQDSTRTQCSSDLPPSPPCPLVVEPLVLERSPKVVFGSLFKGEHPLHQWTTGAWTLLEHNVLGISRPHHHTHPCRTPGSRELSRGCGGSFLKNPLRKGASATSVDNRSQESALERTVLGFSHPPHHASLVVERMVLESSPRVSWLVCACLLFPRGHQLHQLPIFMC